MRKFNLATVLILLLKCLPSQAFITVGQDPGCDFDNLFNAYQDSELEVRVTNEQILTNNFVIEKFKFIRGGFDSCADADNGTLGNEKTKWSGLNALNNTVVEIDTNLAITATVIIENFEIYDGNNTTFTGAGGVKVSGKSNVILRNSVIHSNTGNEGGGLHVYGEDAILTLENTVVRDNTATGFGGGLFCSNGASLIIDETTTIHDNNATSNGGGIFGSQGCDIANSSGEPVLGRLEFGITNNRANKGGGIYLQTAAQIEITGSEFAPAAISSNISDEDSGLGGAGLYLTGENTTAHLVNTTINYNDSLNHGAAMVVTDLATLTMRQAADGCNYGAANSCSRIDGNRTNLIASKGGVGYISEGAEVEIAQTIIASNRSHVVSGFVIENDALLRLEGNLIRNNDSQLAQSSSMTLFYLDGSMNQASQIDFVHNTVANNEVNHFFTADNLNSSQIINVFNSIIWDEGQIYNFNGPSTAQIDCSVVHESTSLSGNVGAILTNDPLFINTVTDYRPSLASDVIDFCDSNLIPAIYNDLNNSPRGFDMASVNNAFGSYDAGAYEYLPPIIFRNGFE